MYILLAYLSLVSVAIPILLYLWRGRVSYKNKMMKILFLYLVVAAVSDLICFVLGKTGYSNIKVLNIFFLLQFYLLSYLYAIYLKKSSLVIAGVIVFTVFSIVNTLFIQPFDEIQSLSDGLQSVLFILFSIACHLHLLKNPSEDENFDAMVFWINMALMFYFSMNLYLFVSSNYIFSEESSDIGLIAWTFHNCFNVLKNVLLGVGIYQAMPQPIRLRL